MLNRRQQRKRGFTITEMLIVLAVVGVMAAVAAPSLSSLFVGNRLDTAANEFATALNFARSEAIRRGVNVRVQRPAGSLYDWTAGWQVKDDVSGEVLRVGQPLAQPLTLFSENGSEYDVVFAATGRKTSAGDRIFVLCYQNQINGSIPKSRSRGVFVTPSGTVQVAPIDASGRPMKPSGATQTPITSCTAP